MERTAAFLKWDVVDEVLIPGVFVEGDVNKTDGCAQATALSVVKLILMRLKE